MDLFRLHAYTVSPSRTADRSQAPRGGAVTINADLRGILDDTTSAAKFDRRTLVDFEMDDNRQNPMRDLFVKFAFGEGSAPRTAALEVASKLSEAMDLRSSPCLLVLAATRDDPRRKITIWTFPRDRALRLHGGGTAARIQILTDVFSQTSKLRKAATFEGRNIRTEFLQGCVLDFQASLPSQQVADFWIGRFLHCLFSINDDAGTRLLAKTIRQAVKTCDDLRDQEALLTAAMAVRTAPQQRWSLKLFADRYLAGEAHRCFEDAIPNQQTYSSLFNLRREEFENALAYRVFALTSGVLVSSPMSEIDHSVRISDDHPR